MRSGRPTHDEMSAIARRRLELIRTELAGRRGAGSGDWTEPADGARAPDGGPLLVDPEAAARAPTPEPVRAGGTVDEPPFRDAGPGAGRHARRPLNAPGRFGGWVHDRLPPTLQGRVRLTAGHLSVVALLVAVAFAVTAWWVVRADGSGTVVPAARWSDTAATAHARSPTPLVTPVADPSASATTGMGGDTGAVVVDVEGKVRHPGIVTLPRGSRVVDALKSAGGVRRGVDLTPLNLARVLADGEQIVVGVKPPGGVAAPAASAPGAGSASAGSMVNINAASQSELEELPGVGPVTAAAIVQWRTEHGPFTSVDQLLEVSGIGDATLADIAPFVTL